MIPKDKLKHGYYYEGRCRNASVARWDEKNNEFVHWRHKFGETFKESIKHPDDEKHFDAFIVEREIGEEPMGVPVIPFD